MPDIHTVTVILLLLPGLVAARGGHGGGWYHGGGSQDDSHGGSYGGSSTTADDDDGGGHGFSFGLLQIVGVVAGGVLLLAVALCICLRCRWRRESRGRRSLEPVRMAHRHHMPSSPSPTPGTQADTNYYQDQVCVQAAFPLSAACACRAWKTFSGGGGGCSSLLSGTPHPPPPKKAPLGLRLSLTHQHGLSGGLGVGVGLGGGVLSHPRGPVPSKRNHPHGPDPAKRQSGVGKREFSSLCFLLPPDLAGLRIQCSGGGNPGWED